MLDFSQHSELSLHAQVIADVQAVAVALGVQPLVIGAFARDLHLVYAHRIPVVRQTEDIDLALAIDGWSTFDELRPSTVGQRSMNFAGGSWPAGALLRRCRYIG